MGDSDINDKPIFRTINIVCPRCHLYFSLLRVFLAVGEGLVRNAVIMCVVGTNEKFRC